MNHQDHVHLLRKGVPAGGGGSWADLGSGGGAFTLALAELLGPSARIYSIDKDSAALRQQRQAMQAQFPEAQVEYRTADFTRPLDLPLLDGIVMANSLHFVRQKDPVLQRIHGYLRPEGRLVLVEYNADRGSPWVPYPFSYQSWQELARRNGFHDITLLEKRPSRFMGEIYSALAIR